MSSTSVSASVSRSDWKLRQSWAGRPGVTTALAPRRGGPYHRSVHVDRPTPAARALPAPEKAPLRERERLSALLLLGAALTAFGCSAQTADYTTDADTGSTHALISIERSTAVDTDNATRAGALAGFLHTPADVDAQAALGVVGLAQKLPKPGQCATLPEGARLSSMGHVELLEAGDISVDVGGTATTLAPRAFPTVTDQVSGVMYTTRDCSEPLPAGAHYTIRTSGGLSVAPLTLDADAPAQLDGVTVGGLPLSDVGALSTSQPVDVTWNVGQPGDLVYVELSRIDGSSSTLCSFRDDVGSGTIPAGMVTPSHSGRLSLHRVRERTFAAGDIQDVELRFDFELAANVSFIE